MIESLKDINPREISNLFERKTAEEVNQNKKKVIQLLYKEFEDSFEATRISDPKLFTLNFLTRRMHILQKIPAKKEDFPDYQGDNVGVKSVFSQLLDDPRFGLKNIYLDEVIFTERPHKQGETLLETLEGLTGKTNYYKNGLSSYELGHY